MLTVSELEHVSLSGMSDAAGGLRRVAARLQHEGSDYGRHVLRPLQRGDHWTGAGRAAAQTVVEADALAVATAVSRLRHAATTLSTFVTAVGDCRQTLSTYLTSAREKSMTVAGDGTVTAGPDADDADEDDATTYTTRIKRQLRMATRLDRLCAATLTRLAGKTADGRPGYALPVFSAYAGDDLLERSREAFGQRYTVGTVTGVSFALSDDLWRRALTGSAQCRLGGSLPPGGGFVLGPDMRLYPITAVSSYPDRSGGGRWRTVGSQVGFDTFDPPSRFELERAQAAILTGLDAPYPMSFADSAQTRQVERYLAHGGHPQLPTSTDATKTATRPPGLTDGRTTHVRWDTDGRPHVVTATTRGGRAAAVPQVATGALQGKVISDHLPDTYEYAYRTTYQQDEHGRVRAVVERYQVGFDGGQRKLAAQSAYLGENGRYIPVRLDGLPPGISAPGG